jgi:ABC-type transport system substrate-binding protein
MAKAAALMKEAGACPIDTTISFDLGDAVNSQPIAELIQESLAKIGITTTINKVPGSNWRSEMAKKSMPMMVTSSPAGWTTRNTFSSGAIPARTRSSTRLATSTRTWTPSSTARALRPPWAKRTNTPPT